MILITLTAIVPPYTSHNNNMTKKTFIIIITLFAVSISANFVFAKETCHVDIKDGKIPIGEAVDESELFAQKLIDEFENIHNQGISIRDKVSAMRNEAESEIDQASTLISLTSPTSCKNCSALPCSDGHCSCNTCWSTCCSGDPPSCSPCNPHCCSPCSCPFCTGTPCPFTNINNTYNQIKIHYDNLETYYNNTKDRPQKISNLKNKAINLIKAENLIEADPNRWKILNKLIDSRKKFEKCITGYEIVEKQEKSKMQILSCDIALNKINLGEILITGYFQENEYPRCYAYTANDEIKNTCEEGHSAKKCQDKINENNVMHNYFCCEGE